MRWAGGLDEDLVAEPATTATIVAADNFTDNFGSVGDRGEENKDTVVKDYYNGSTVDYVGNIESAKTDVPPVSLSTGLTNDATPELTFAFDNPVLADQAVKIVRHTIVNGESVAQEDITPTNIVGQKTVSITDDLAETYGTAYRYEVVLDNNVVATHEIKLDTMVDGLEVESIVVDDSTRVATITLADSAAEKYKLISSAADITTTQSADGFVKTITINDFDRLDPNGVTLTVVDAAGNVNDQRIMVMRNLFSRMDVAGTDGALGPDSTLKSIYGNNNGGFDDDNYYLRPQNVSDDPTKAFMTTNGNDTLILGLDNYPGWRTIAASDATNDNGSISDSNANRGTENWDGSFALNMGAGDDFVHVRKIIRDLRGGVIDLGDGNDKLISEDGLDAGAEAKIIAGEGNDYIRFGGNINYSIGEHSIDLGNGDNTFIIDGEVAQAATVNITGGTGDDYLYVAAKNANGANYDGDGVVNLGDGNNLIHTMNSLTGKKQITTGDGNDSIWIEDDLGAAGVLLSWNTIKLNGGDDRVTIHNDLVIGELDFGDGDDSLFVGGKLKHYSNTQMGTGNDTVTIGGEIWNALGSGSKMIDGGTNTDGTPENDILLLNGEDQVYRTWRFKNFETVDMSQNTTAQTFEVKIDDLIIDDTLTTKVLGTAGVDTVDFRYSAGTWSSTTGETIDGTLFDIYTNTSSPDEKLYVQANLIIVS